MSADHRLYQTGVTTRGCRWEESVYRKTEIVQVGPGDCPLQSSSEEAPKMEGMLKHANAGK